MLILRNRKYWYVPVWFSNTIIPFKLVLVDFDCFIPFNCHHFVHLVIFNTVRNDTIVAFIYHSKENGFLSFFRNFKLVSFNRLRNAINQLEYLLPSVFDDDKFWVIRIVTLQQHSPSGPFWRFSGIVQIGLSFCVTSKWSTGKFLRQLFVKF